MTDSKKHIKQDNRRGKTPAESVTVAEGLAKVLVHISAHYNPSCIPGEGIDVNLTESFSEMKPDDILALLQHAHQGRMTRGVPAQEVKAQLDLALARALGKSTGSSIFKRTRLSLEEIVIISTDIFTLQEEGIIESNEFNGMLYMYDLAAIAEQRRAAITEKR